MGVVYLAERADLGNPAAIKMLRDAWLSPARRRALRRRAADARPARPSLIARLLRRRHAARRNAVLRDGVRRGRADHRLLPAPREPRSRNVWSCSARSATPSSTPTATPIIHRDLKPSNILVKPDGAVRLLDFGIAKQLEASTTPPGARTGRPAADDAGLRRPEQIRGERWAIHSDVYALGVILYELLTGGCPTIPTGISDTERGRRRSPGSPR